MSETNVVFSNTLYDKSCKDFENIFSLGDDFARVLIMQRPHNMANSGFRNFRLFAVYKKIRVEWSHIF